MSNSCTKWNSFSPSDSEKFVIVFLSQPMQVLNLVVDSVASVIEHRSAQGYWINTEQAKRGTGPTPFVPIITSSSSNVTEWNSCFTSLTIIRSKKGAKQRVRSCCLSFCLSSKWNCCNTKIVGNCYFRCWSTESVKSEGEADSNKRERCWAAVKSADNLIKITWLIALDSISWRGNTRVYSSADNLGSRCSNEI